MTSYDESHIAGLFAVEAPTPLPDDWDDVLSRVRAGRRGRQGRMHHILAGRRRLMVVLTAMALAVTLGGAAAFGIRALLAERGFIGLPPQGAVPSAPEHGRLVLRARGRCTSGGYLCFVWIYRDGRLIWIRDSSLPPYGANKRTTGLLEQHLTSTGVRLLRAAFIATGECTLLRARKSVECFPPFPGPAPFPAIAHPGWDDVHWGLPEIAWEEPKVRAFVPARFAFCFQQSSLGSTPPRKVEFRRVLAVLPPAAGRLLRGKNPEPRNTFWSDPVKRNCFALTTMESRRMAKILDRAQVTRVMQPYVLAYRIDLPSHVRESIWFAPMLPSGEWVATGGG